MKKNYLRCVCVCVCVCVCASHTPCCPTGDVGPEEMEEGGSVTDKFNLHITPLLSSRDTQSQLHQVLKHAHSHSLPPSLSPSLSPLSLPPSPPPSVPGACSGPTARDSAQEDLQLSGHRLTTFYKKLASMVAEKRDVPYAVTLNWIRCRLSFALLRASIMSISGASPAAECPIDLAYMYLNFY